MIYRIRYRKPDVDRDREFTVEANSPTEAMVKFQHAWDSGPLSGCGDLVTSVRAEEACCDFSP